MDDTQNQTTDPTTVLPTDNAEGTTEVAATDGASTEAPVAQEVPVVATAEQPVAEQPAQEETAAVKEEPTA